jgi:peroxin-11C
MVDHLYYPVDKICWAIDSKILNPKNPEKWDTLNSLFWASSIYLNLMK